MTLAQLLHEKRDAIRRIATAHGAYNFACLVLWLVVKPRHRVTSICSLMSAPQRARGFPQDCCLTWKNSWGVTSMS